MITAQSETLPISEATLAKTRKIVLAGNPNVGKSVIFNTLTGLNVDVSNYPGTTIDITSGKLNLDDLTDTPGVYGVSSFNDEERVAKTIILDADLVINIASALSLDRDLFLTLQLLEMGKPTILVLNQWDEAENRGIKIDTRLLSELLGVPVLTCIAVRNKGIKEIEHAIAHACKGKIEEELLALLLPLTEKGIDQAQALLILEGDEQTATECGIKPQDQRNAIYRMRRRTANQIVAEVVIQEDRKTNFSLKLGHFLLHPIYGTITALTVCYLIFYQLLGVFIAIDLVDITEHKIMRAYYEPFIQKTTALFFPNTVTIGNTTYNFPSGALLAPSESQRLAQQLSQTPKASLKYNFWPAQNLWALLGNIISGEYGVLTLTVTYIIGLLLPLVTGFYFGLSLLEDSGYLPRLAVLVDRLMNKIGLNGRAIIPLILGLGCVTMATITTRLLSTKREKIIATALLGVAIPCSAQLGVVSGILARTGGLLCWTIYGFVIFSILAATGLLLNLVMPGQSGSLMIDLPPMRFPRMDNVVKKTWKKSYFFLQESVPMFAFAGFVVTIAQITGMLDLIILWLHPITVSWLHLPNDPRVATTFILGIVRRDFGAFGLTDVSMTAVQAVVATIVITLFVPCIATVGIMIKERGMKIALSIWFGSWVFAFTFGGILAYILPPLFKIFGS